MALAGRLLEPKKYTAIPTKQSKTLFKGTLYDFRSPKFCDTCFVKYLNINYIKNQASYVSIELKIIDFLKNSFPLPNTKLGFVISPVKRLLVM